MAQDTSLNGLRNQLITQLYGRRIGLSIGNSSDNTAQHLSGFASIREPVMGVSSAGSTIVSTSVATPLPAYGVSLVGASAASGTTAYNLAAPIPGVRKVLFVPTTGYAVVGTTDAGAFICSSASVTSTYGIITFTGKGNMCEMIGLTTALWGVVTNYAITTVTTGNTVSFV